MDILIQVISVTILIFVSALVALAIFTPSVDKKILRSISFSISALVLAYVIAIIFGGEITIWTVLAYSVLQIIAIKLIMDFPFIGASFFYFALLVIVMIIRMSFNEIF